MNTEKFGKGLKIAGFVFMGLVASALVWSLCNPVTSGPTLDEFNKKTNSQP